MLSCTRLELAKGASNVNCLLHAISHPLMHEENSRRIDVLKFENATKKLFTYNAQIDEWNELPIPEDLPCELPLNIVGCRLIIVEYVFIFLNNK